MARCLVDLIAGEESTDAKAAAFIIAELLKMWRDSMTKKK